MHGFEFQTRIPSYVQQLCGYGGQDLSLTQIELQLLPHTKFINLTRYTHSVNASCSCKVQEDYLYTYE